MEVLIGKSAAKEFFSIFDYWRVNHVKSMSISAFYSAWLRNMDPNIGDPAISRGETNQTTGMSMSEQTDIFGWFSFGVSVGWHLSLISFTIIYIILFSFLRFHCLICTYCIVLLFPTCHVRVVRFYQSCSPPPPPHPPPPPRSPDPSGHSRTSTASSRSQWALPGLNRELQIAVGTAGPQPRLPGRSGHCRTSTATSRLQWALPDLNRDFQIAVGTAGPQREECQKRCQIECQKICQIECQKECQKRMSEDMPDRMSEDMPERMSEDMSDRMSEDMPDRMPGKMSEDMPDRMSERMSEDMPERMS